MGQKSCVVCGCTEERACVSADGKPCFWIDENEAEPICSACAESDAASCPLASDGNAFLLDEQSGLWLPPLG